MLVPVELKQEIIFFSSVHCLHVKVELRMKKKKIYRANKSPCLPPLSMGMSSPDVEQSMVEKHGCVDAWNRMRYIPSLFLSSSRLQLLPFWKGEVSRGWNLRADTESDS